MHHISKRKCSNLYELILKPLYYVYFKYHMHFNRQLVEFGRLNLSVLYPTADKIWVNNVHIFQSVRFFYMTHNKTEFYTSITFQRGQTSVSNAPLNVLGDIFTFDLNGECIIQQGWIWEAMKVHGAAETIPGYLLLEVDYFGLWVHFLSCYQHWVHLQLVDKRF